MQWGYRNGVCQVIGHSELHVELENASDRDQRPPPLAESCLHIVFVLFVKHCYYGPAAPAIMDPIRTVGPNRFPPCTLTSLLCFALVFSHGWLWGVITVETLLGKQRGSSLFGLVDEAQPEQMKETWALVIERMCL